MDAPRFDRFAKILVAPRSRRGALGTLLGSALALVTSRDADIPQGVASKKKRGNRMRHKRKDDRVAVQGPCGNGSGKANRCKRNGQCCTNFCHKKKGRCRCHKPGDPCTEDRNCCPERTGATCQDGICQPCGAASAACSAETACCPGLTCLEGVCQAQDCAVAGESCGAGIFCCPELVCVDGACQSAATCAGLGAACSAELECCEGLSCDSGQCAAISACPVDCDDGNPCTSDDCDPDGNCVNTSVPNGTPCPGDGPNTTGICEDGACEITCSAGFGDCDGDPATGCETNLQTDTRNCGVCNNVCEICPDGTVAPCISGVCEVVVCDADGTPPPVGGGD